MHTLRLLSAGFALATRHKRLIVVLWLVPLLPALVIGAMAASNLSASLGHSLFSDRVLDGDWFAVWSEFKASPSNDLEPMLHQGVLVLALLTLGLHLVVSAGVVEVVLERRAQFPFVLGARRNFLRFLRTAVIHLGATALVIVPCALVTKGCFKLAETRADGRLDILGVVLAAALFLLLWAPLDLASDLSRIAAVRHDDRSMLRGYLRCVGAVLRRPGLFVPLYLAFVTLPLGLSLIYYGLRAPWTPSTAGAILVLLLGQQAVMLGRATLKLLFWGAEVAAFRDLGQPPWCKSKERAGPPIPEPIELPAQQPA